MNYSFASKSTSTIQEPDIQALSPIRVNSLHLVKADVPFLLSYCYEWAIGKETVINLDVSAKEITGLISEDHYFIPGLKLEPRYYYGYNKRNKRRQIISNNASDFIAFETSYQWLWKYDPTDKYYQFSLIPKWGLRRSVGKHFILELAFGCSLFTTIEKKINIAPHVETSFGYVFKLKQ